MPASNTRLKITKNYICPDREAQVFKRKSNNFRLARVVACNAVNYTQHTASRRRQQRMGRKGPNHTDGKPILFTYLRKQLRSDRIAHWTSACSPVPQTN